MNTGILIVGTGALATLFAVRLSLAGVDVTMLGSWPEGLAALHNRGASLDGRDSLPIRATNNPADCIGAKIALVLVKSWQTEYVAKQLADCLAEDSLAVTLQNGLGNDKILSRTLTARRVSRGVTTLGATLLAPGIVRSGGEGVVMLEAHERLEALEEVLEAGNFEVSVIKNAEPVVWSKLIVNAAINPLTALLRMKNGEILGNPPARALMGELAREASLVAKALGIELPFLSPESAVEEVAHRTADNISSMFQDVLRGAPTEVDAINGAVINLGKQEGLETPFNQAIWYMVKALPVRLRYNSFHLGD